MVTYYCEAGYVLRGSKTRRCALNGYWTGTVPECVGKTWLTFSGGYISHVCFVFQRSSIVASQLPQGMEESMLTKLQLVPQQFITAKKALNCLARHRGFAS